MAGTSWGTWTIGVILNVLIFVSVLLFTPGLPPANVTYESYTVTPPWILEPNGILDQAEIFVGPEEGIEGPESIAVRGDEIFTGVSGGRILRINSQGQISTVATIVGDCGEAKWEEGIKCGRPLGMRFDASGHLIVADAFFGLFRINVDTGKTEQLMSAEKEIDGKRPMFPDDLDISRNGEIYWSDGSTTAHMPNSIVEYLGTGSGRVIKFDPKTKTSTVLMNELHFANGIQLSPSEDFLLVSETMRSRVWRYFLKGKREGQKEIFLDGLPGLPDNIRPNGNGGYYIALAFRRDAKNPSIGDMFGHLPLVRKLILRILGLIDLFLSYLSQILPWKAEIEAMRIYFAHVGPFGDPENLPNKVTILEVSNDGQIIRTLQTDQSEMRIVSQASVGKEFTYFGSFVEPRIWRIKNSLLKTT